MLNDVVDNDQTFLPTTTAQQWEIEIPAALPVRLQTLDLARHVAIAPDGKRYVVASFDDTRLVRGYVTAIYPQQNGYLTLIRLTINEAHSPTPQQAVELHIKTVEAIQQGKIRDYLK
jgi:hypothetical protein